MAEHCAVVHIGAAQVQFNSGKAGDVFGEGRHFLPLLRAFGGHAHYDVGVHCGPLRGQVAHGRLDAGVGQADGVEQRSFAGGQSFPERWGEPARFRVADAGMARDGFGQHGAQLMQRSVRRQAPAVAVIAEGSRRNQRRVGQAEAAGLGRGQVYGKVDRTGHGGLRVLVERFAAAFLFRRLRAWIPAQAGMTDKLNHRFGNAAEI